MEDEIRKLQGLVIAQQKYLINLKSKLQYATECISEAYNNEAKFGIIINKKDIHLLLVPNDNISKYYESKDLASDKINTIYRDSVYSDVEITDYRKKLVNIPNKIYIHNYSIYIDDYELDWVCCSDNYIICPKSSDFHGRKQLDKLYDKLINSGRIHNKVEIGYDLKKCLCS
jgi:hypothetical protein